MGRIAGSNVFAMLPARSAARKAEPERAKFVYSTARSARGIASESRYHAVEISGNVVGIVKRA